MEEKKYLNEEKYLKTKKKISLIALCVLVIGILIGGGLIAIGFIKQNETSSKYSLENKNELSQQLDEEQKKLLAQKETIETDIKPIEEQIQSLNNVPFTGFDDAYYERKNQIESLEKDITDEKNTIQIIDNALLSTFNYCEFSEVKNNSYTMNYCSLKLELDAINNSFNKQFDASGSIPFYIIGGFVLVVSLIISGIIYLSTKKRELLAYSVQQVMPIAEEGMDTMAPVMGNVAKEITKGIKEGIDDKQK